MIILEMAPSMAIFTLNRRLQQSTHLEHKNQNCIGNRSGYRVSLYLPYSTCVLKYLVLTICTTYSFIHFPFKSRLYVNLVITMSKLVFIFWICLFQVPLLLYCTRIYQVLEYFAWQWSEPSSLRQWFRILSPGLFSP